MEENKTIAEEERQKYLDEINCLKEALCESSRRNEEYEEGKRKDAIRIVNLESQLSERNKKLEECSEYMKLANDAAEANVDITDVVKVMRRRIFGTNSDASRFLNGEIDPNNPYLKDMGLEEMIKSVMRRTSAILSENKMHNNNEGNSKGSKVVKMPKLTAKDKSVNAVTNANKRGIYTATVLKKMGIDYSNLPDNAKLIKRKDKDGGDTWYVRTFEYVDAQVVCNEYKVGRFNVPGSDPQSGKHPDTIIKGNPVMPSFARFYLFSKFFLNLSENRILEALKTMYTKIPQATLNYWMHQIMEMMRTRMEPVMLEAIKKSRFTHNDETRIRIRSRKSKTESFKYHTEYIQAVLSPEQKLVVMLYDEGTRSHELQEEKVFKGSSIKYFIADRAKLYETIENDLVEYHVERTACWFHGRHYLVDAFIVDKRVKHLIQMINLLFEIERQSVDRKHTPEQRFIFRLKYSRPIVLRIMNELEKIRLSGNEYGEMVHRAVNYILDDKKAFMKFLQDGQIEMHNNAIERMFRHIAIGRRNWLHSGSHFAASNIGFMYSLLESCKLNGVDFGEYVEDILTRMMNGQEVNESFLPNHYAPTSKKQETAAA